MTDAELRQPGDVARELDISTSTLRRWAKEFHSYLSRMAGRPDSAGAVGTHRRYTDEDVELLRRAKGLLDQGLTYDQVIRRLRREGLQPSEESGPREEAYPILAPEKQAESTALAPGFVVVADALRNINDSQQALQNSLQVNRNLLGVLIQDNFNLKEENSKLRDRLLKLEQSFNELRQEKQEKEASPLSPAQQRELQSRKGCLGTSAK
jgi:DNA-binding transcriptional MerR regulator